MAGTITSIEQQSRRKDRINVYLDDRYAFSLNAIVAERAGLKKGIFLDDQAIDGLVGDDAYQKAFDRALNFLSYRPRSEREVRANLSRKKIEVDVLERVVGRLKELALIDDRAFAQYWQENRQRFSPRGPRAIQSELRAKGLDRDIIDEVVDTQADQTDAAYEAALRKARSLHGLDYQAFRQRLGSHLLRRGFSYDTISSVSERLWRELSTQAPEEDY